MELIDPTSELAPETRQPLPRLLASNTDVTVGLLDISKPKGDVFLNRVEDLLQQRGIKTCLLYTSPSPRDVEESRMPSSA